MNNPFKYSDDNKRYHTLNYYYKHKYNSKVFKVSLNAGFSCPNIDGIKSTLGCSYCSKSGSGEFGGNVNEPLKVQFDTVKNRMLKKWPNAKYIGYFQARSNTYAPVSVLKEKYEEVLRFPGVVGLNIATRADCISESCLLYLEDLNKRTELTVELGLQSIHDKTAKRINRCHDLETFYNTVLRLREKNIDVVVHIINGLPGEDKEDMLDTVRYLNKLDIQGIKIHMLSILKDTPIYQEYKNKKFHVLSKDDYIDIVISQLELLREEIVIHRITGDPPQELCVEPKWLFKKFCVLNDIDKEMVKRDTYQGKFA